MNYGLGLCAVVAGVLCLAVSAPQARAEMYIAGQVGATLPKSLSGIELTAGGATGGIDDLQLNDSVMYGAKLGYYFESIKWLGVETEVFNSNPSVKQKDFGNGLILPGQDFRVLTWAPINVLVRLQMGKFEPYAGVGLGVFFSHLSGPSGSSSGTDVGLNTQLGLRFRVSDHVALFGEWKYNYANINHSDVIGNGGVDLSANYNANHLAFGVSYHF
ncbi:outer membrane beta-barrel protein [Nitrospira sp. NS4]|uniref:outer membrane beta-barrel protein n=1 Tax=Nitrospira sp. NS4 TaxID=3414498 RepID=UPI003C2D9F3D